MEAVTGRIRPIVICLFRNGSRILAAEGVDPGTKQKFYRPLGGEVEFGEAGIRALEREMAEELDRPIEGPVFLGLLENLFTYCGEQGHELVLVFDARLADPSLYRKDRIPCKESDGSPFDAIWLDLDKDVPGGLPLYPDGLRDFIKSHEKNN